MPGSGAGRWFACKEIIMSYFGSTGVSYREASAPRRGRGHRRAAMRLIPRVDRLDERVLLSTWTVTNTNSSGMGSLPCEINLAASGDTIDATRVSGTIRLNGELAIGK